MQQDQLIEYIKSLVPLSDIKKEENQKELFKNIVLGKSPKDNLLVNIDLPKTDTFYLVDGELEITDSLGNTIKLNSTNSQCRFPIGFNQSDKFSVKTCSEVIYLKIDTETLDALLTWDQVTSPLLKKPSHSQGGDETHWMSRILELELFQRIPPVNIQAMFLRFEISEYEQEEIIIEQDTPGDYYYVIKTGRCAIYRSDDVKDVPLQHKLAELGPGDSFGEEALVSDSLRNATVVMREAGELARLSKENFLTLLKDPVIKSVTAEEATELVSKGGVYIDVRTANEYQQQHQENSLNLPLSTIREHLSELDKNKSYVVYCDSGSRSAAACYILSQHGFAAYLLDNTNNQ
ncbi:MAG: cyclic nucleotide-binding domain-containing protein [Gammaproteobacteria bacterium]|nr:cyclic nucleotide-binding domain-containing protein [Gammaproteobacteria bacterium]